MTDGRAFGWDEPTIDNPNEGSAFTVLPPGEYPYEIKKFARGEHQPKPGGKLPRCPKAIITIAVDGGPLGAVEIDTNLFLHSRCEGMLSQFFVSCGLRKHGEPLVMRWDQIVGRAGMVKLDVRAGNKEGALFNEVKRFLDPPAPTQFPWEQGQQAQQPTTETQEEYAF
jgi:hypothetical protein